MVCVGSVIGSACAVDAVVVVGVRLVVEVVSEVKWLGVEVLGLV